MNRLLTLLFLWTLAVSSSARTRIPLTGEWLFSRSGDTTRYPALVPGTVHDDLLRNGLIPDPFTGRNEYAVQWVEEEDWEYVRTFELEAADLAHDRVRLCFEGLDTYADIWLNGRPVGRTDNMFVGYAFDVRPMLRPGTNRLHVRFRSPVREVMAQRNSAGFDYPADNDHRTEKTSVYSRKAPYSYGWDWGIRLVTSGIWKPVYLECWDGVRIADYYVRVLEADEDRAVVERVLSVEAAAAGPAAVDFACVPPGDAAASLFDTLRVSLQAGMNEIRSRQTVSDPELWMPNGWGTPHLYEFSACVRTASDTVRQTERVGLREARLIREADAAGTSFYFEINGRPLFAKGANLIPGDALLPRMDSLRYVRLISDAVAAGYNMIRVWGGGIYESDLFYRLADEAGILVWQDFMFACTAYPADPDFLERVREEAEYNVRRLRRHPSLVLWCGNNEVLEGLKYWGWQRRFAGEPGLYERMKADYDTLFRNLLPEVVRRLDPDRDYIHGSPLSANWGRPESWGDGDAHDWGLWYGRKPFERMDEDRFRFVSEFGFQSFPEMKTVASFSDTADWSLDSDVMRARQKASTGNGLMQNYLEMYYPVPEDFPSFVYAVQVLQGRGMRDAVEAHRRHRPYCMGSLYWQMNDSWPAISWSGIDYYGNWKALHYQMRRAFAPELVSLHLQGDSLEVYLISDRLEARRRVPLTLEIRDVSGRVLRRLVRRTDWPANATVCAWRLAVEDCLPEGLAWKDAVLVTRFPGADGKVRQETHYLVRPREMQVPEASLQVRAECRSGCWILELRSDGLARDVFLELPVQGARFTDNYFDLLPGERKRIRIESPELPACPDLPRNPAEGPVLQIRQLADLFRATGPEKGTRR